MPFLSQPQFDLVPQLASTSSGSSRLAKRVLLGSLKSLISEDLTSEGSKSQSEASAGVAPESIQGTPKHVILTARGRRPSSRQQGGRNQPVHNNRTSSYRLNFESQSQEFEELFWFKH